MQNIVIFTLVLAFVYILLFFVKVKSDDSFLGKGHTDILKGYATLGVLFGHVAAYSGVEGFEFVSGVSVTLFIMLSGYGVYYSYTKKGFKLFWIKRLLRVYLPYFICESMYFIISGRRVGLLNLVLDFLLIKPLHPFCWYLAYIMVCYIFFYVTRRVFKKDKTFFIALLCMFSIWFVLRSTVFISLVPFLQARQMLAFPIGVLLAIYKDRVVKWVTSFYVSIPMIIFGTALYAFLHTSVMNVNNTPHLLFNFISLFTVSTCALGIIGFVYRCTLLLNYGFIFVAKISVELYLVHGYLSWLVQKTPITGLIVFLLITVALSCLLHLTVDYISDIVLKRKLELKSL